MGITPVKRNVADTNLLIGNCDVDYAVYLE